MTSLAGEVAARCAVLLRGGVSPERALTLAVEELTVDTARVPEQLRETLNRGDHSVADSLATVALACSTPDGPEWRLLAAAWHLATRSGAPLAGALDRIAAALQSLVQLRERRETLLAAPKITVRMVVALPPLALVLGVLLGFDPVPVLLGPVGVVLLVVGAALLYTGMTWARAMSRSVEEQDRVAGLELELAWIVLSGGTASTDALLRVADCVSDIGVEWVRFDDLCQGQPLRDALATAEQLGVPVGPLLLETADAIRARSLADLESEAERLGVRVLIPLGVCVLPAFITLGVLPVLLSMLGGLG